MTISQIALGNGTSVDRNGYKEREAQHDEYCSDKPRYTRVRPGAQLPFALEDKPCCAKQGITEHQADPGQYRKRM